MGATAEGKGEVSAVATVEPALFIGAMGLVALAVALTVSCWVGGNVLPFGQLVNWIYPTVGYVGLLFLVCQIYKDVKRQPAD